jgi:hypothetical protein
LEAETLEEQFERFGYQPRVEPSIRVAARGIEPLPVAGDRKQKPAIGFQEVPDIERGIELLLLRDVYEDPRTEDAVELPVDLPG